MRVAGLLQARLPELGLEAVPDPRAREGRWSLAQILRATLRGLMAGFHRLSETEALTDRQAPAMRLRLGLQGGSALRSRGHPSRLTGVETTFSGG
jgi:hypothetical protein